MRKEKPKGQLTVAEAGRKGGLRTKETHAPDYYVKIGSLGGQRIKQMLAQGRELEDAEDPEATDDAA